MNDDYKKQDDTGRAIVPPATDDEVGENSASGNTPDPDTANQVDSNFKAAFGNNPDGETLAEEVDKDEHNLQEE
jgi:hypothetical protein